MTSDGEARITGTEGDLEGDVSSVEVPSDRRPV
jgi:hypothetical protein